MQRDATTPGLEAGLLAEVRVAQAWFWDGLYVRRGVDLQHRFGAEVSTVTDLDVLGYSISPSLGHWKRIGEVKTGTSRNTPRPLDRALWMSGLRTLVRAQESEVTTAFHVSLAVRDACTLLGSSMQHLDELAAREQRLQIANVGDSGAHGPAAALMRQRVHTFSKGDARLERAYWFLTSEIWFLDSFDALKRTLGLIRELARTWPPETHEEAFGVANWFFAEAISVTVLHLTLLAGESNAMNQAAFESMAVARLSSGDIPFHSARKLAERVDEYVAKLLRSVDAPADVQMSAMGAFSPVPPSYLEPLLDLVARLGRESAVTSELPRQVDLLLFERLVRRREVSSELQTRLRLTDDSTRLVRVIAAFLRGQIGLPSPVELALTASLHVEKRESDGTPTAISEGDLPNTRSDIPKADARD